MSNGYKNLQILDQYRYWIKLLDVEDLVQEMFVTGFQWLKQYEEHTVYKTWLSKIQINKCLCQLKYRCFRYEVQSCELIGEIRYICDP